MGRESLHRTSGMDVMIIDHACMSELWRWFAVGQKMFFSSPWVPRFHYDAFISPPAHSTHPPSVSMPVKTEAQMYSLLAGYRESQKTVFSWKTLKDAPKDVGIPLEFLERCEYRKEILLILNPFNKLRLSGISLGIRTSFKASFSIFRCPGDTRFVKPHHRVASIGNTTPPGVI